MRAPKESRKQNDLTANDIHRSIGVQPNNLAIHLIHLVREFQTSPIGPSLSFVSRSAQNPTTPMNDMQKFGPFADRRCAYRGWPCQSPWVVSWKYI
ncbi:hypothetical protein SISNIDRAFT_169539 [Sistotremastrum niveocremeum HHB9708]|uniref:Uncharacterized protein n=1 Tax=Sistotremastrum niveocremeum HHB9708 TaxID=1314777 RepID=A0A164S1P0_9AGAM|nr:hypothetical protein SISNIDRAFT_169539 [Sistotremastrum niveocremeum HHB9708]